MEYFRLEDKEYKWVQHPSEGGDIIEFMLGNQCNAQEIWEGLVVCGYVEGRTADVTDEYKDGLTTKGLFAPTPGMIFDAKTSVRRDAFRDIMKKAKSQGSVLEYSNFQSHLQISRIYAMVSAKSSLDSKTASKTPRGRARPRKVIVSHPKLIITPVLKLSLSRKGRRRAPFHPR